MMRAVFRVALLSSLFAGSLPAIAEGQNQPFDSLVQRVAFLELKTVELERRIHELEALIKTGPSQDSPTRAAGNWRELGNWRRLRRGMTTTQVRAIIGEPDKVEAGSSMTIWTWGKFPDYATVRFDDDKLDGWTEPGR
jgi:hypothetical protein